MARQTGLDFSKSVARHFGVVNHSSEAITLTPKEVIIKKSGRQTKHVLTSEELRDICIGLKPLGVFHGMDVTMQNVKGGGCHVIVRPNSPENPAWVTLRNYFKLK